MNHGKKVKTTFSARIDINRMRIFLEWWNSWKLF